MSEEFIYTAADIGNIRTYRYFLPIPANDSVKYIVYNGESLEWIDWNNEYMDSVIDGCIETIDYWLINRYATECNFDTIMKLRKS